MSRITTTWRDILNNCRAINCCSYFTATTSWLVINHRVVTMVADKLGTVARKKFTLGPRD